MNIAHNYLEDTSTIKIPLENLKYLFSEILYGGHISDKFDRRTCQVYLDEFIQEKMVIGFFYIYKNTKKKLC